MAESPPEDVELISRILVEGCMAERDLEQLAREIVDALKEKKRLLPAGMTDVYLYYIHRWRNLQTGEVQEALHARHSPDGWVQDRRREVRARGDWEQIS